LKKARTIRRNALAAMLSVLFHAGMLALIISQATPDYDLPETPAPPMDVRIMPMEEPPPPPPPVILPRTLPPPTPTPPTAAPPKPAPPSPELPKPPRPEPPTPPRPSPVPTPAVPAPPAPTPAPIRPAPVAPEAPRPLPTPAPRPQSKPVAAPPKAQAAPAPPAPLSRLNIHKPEKDAPNSVATAPFAPAPASAAGAPRSAQSASGAPSADREPDMGGSRLSGLLNPGLFGGMPGGGGGLRGTLVGCANADVVRLSAVERARCNDRLGVEAGSAPALDTMSPAKRAAFDKASAGQEADRKYRAAVPTGTTTGNHGFGGLGPDQPDGLANQLNHLRQGGP
jgi:hypothetical protein